MGHNFEYSVSDMLSRSSIHNIKVPHSQRSEKNEVFLGNTSLSCEDKSFQITGHVVNNYIDQNLDSACQINSISNSETIEKNQTIKIHSNANIQTELQPTNQSNKKVHESLFLADNTQLNKIHMILPDAINKNKHTSLLNDIINESRVLSKVTTAVFAATCSTIQEQEKQLSKIKHILASFLTRRVSMFKKSPDENLVTTILQDRGIL